MSSDYPILVKIHSELVNIADHLEDISESLRSQKNQSKQIMDIFNQIPNNDKPFPSAWSQIVNPVSEKDVLTDDKLDLNK